MAFDLIILSSARNFYINFNSWLVFFEFLYTWATFWHLFLLIKQPGMEKGRNCYSDEHYLPTFFYVRTIVLSFCGYLVHVFNFLTPLQISLYLSLTFQMLDPAGIANWSVTHVDWSEGKWHPKSYKAQDISFELMKNITVCVVLYYFSAISFKYSVWLPNICFHRSLSKFLLCHMS